MQELASAYDMAATKNHHGNVNCKGVQQLSIILLAISEAAVLMFTPDSELFKDGDSVYC